MQEGLHDSTPHVGSEAHVSCRLVTAAWLKACCDTADVHALCDALFSLDDLLCAARTSFAQMAHKAALTVFVCRITDAGIILLVAQSPNLQQLSLYWNVHVTDTPLYKVASLCTQLTHLNLSGCKRITDKGLTAVARTCHQLIDVDLTRYCALLRAPTKQSWQLWHLCAVSRVLARQSKTAACLHT